MKKTTYGLPEACKHCGNTDKDTWSGDWTGIDCQKCGKRTPYVVVKVEEIAVP
jgi:translation initiation factor 2 beta subunit (eIF-2beta)/eIF-5